ncbi:THO complex subunit 5 [Fasciola gigantica]|uniref:THO complex subunit 5 n=1 Tax=Fasciola gigantica TaxID=46835 RepID=A0A504YNI8_FASGI|nr:THO complex subunit 5 [Fasciola gigantica]
MPAESESVQVSNSFYWEESTVSVGSSAEDLLLFRKHCRDLREVIHNTWVQKQSGEKISSAKFASLILSLKELNRRTQFRIRKARDRTTEQKLNVDKLHLNLQNLLYEVAHLENEIKTCLEFKSQHEKLSLIPVEEFFLATGRQSELKFSSSWSASCQKLMQSVESVSQEISQKRKYLASFAPKLKELVDNTLVIQKLMDLPFSKEEEQHQLAFLLPTPLYILYTYLKSYLSTMDYPPQTSVEIEGDGELAKAVNQAAAATSALGIDLSPDAEESDMDDVAEEKKRKTKRRKGDVSSHPPSHASNKAISLHPLRVVFRLAYPCGPNGKEDSHCPNQILPSSLSSVPVIGATFVCEKPQIQLTLSFAWIANLGLVTVRMRVRSMEQSQQQQQQPTVDSSLDSVDAVIRSVSGNELLRSESLLFNLHPIAACSDSITADTPVLPPGVITSPVQWDACESVGRPYLWAQQLCGLVPLPEQEAFLPNTLPDAAMLESGYGSARFGHLDSWLKAVTERLAGRISLLRELTAIEAGRPVLSKEQQKLVPRTVEVRLTNWKKSSMSALENVPRARKLIALKLIQSSDLIFHCEFHRSEYVPVPVWVAVPPEYPNRAPVLVVHNPGHETSMTTRAKNRIEWELSDLNLQVTHQTPVW